MGRSIWLRLGHRQRLRAAVGGRLRLLADASIFVACSQSTNMC
jgi:hypothetical protein